MKICVHTLFKNEVNWLWYSVSSVVDHVDRVMLWDTGSTDGSYEIAKLLKNKYPDKIELKQVGEVTAEEFPKIRQQMLEETKEDWILVVDADEVWWNDAITKLVETIKRNKDLEMIISKNINPVGDIFHVLPNSDGKYKIDEHEGFVNIRAMNTEIVGLHASGAHGVQGYYDANNSLIQNRDKDKKVYLDQGYLHLTNLKRSGFSEMEKDVPKRSKKHKFDLGVPVSLNFYYPEVFFQDRPLEIASPWQTRSLDFVAISLLQKPFKIVKRVLGLNKKYGY